MGEVIEDKGSGSEPSKERPFIFPSKDGPYAVTWLTDFINSKGQKIETKPTMVLCRCGQSGTKPFCDGTHAKVGFKGDKEPDRVADKLDDYQGKEITVHDNRGACAHTGICTDHLPAVWKMGVEPWIHPDNGKPQDIASVTRLCPSGALSHTIGGELVKNHDRTPRIIINKDGPYRVQGRVELRDPDGNKPESEEHFTLCRCGKSKNKPFCNGQHWYVKFRDDRN